jgi:hypothetical protein
MKRRQPEVAFTQFTEFTWFAESSTTLYINTLTNPNFQKLLEFDGAHVHTQDTGIIHRDGTLRFLVPSVYLVSYYFE